MNTFLSLHGVTKDKTRSLVMKSEKEGRDQMEVTFIMATEVDTGLLMQGSGVEEINHLMRRNVL